MRISRIHVPKCRSRCSLQDGSSDTSVFVSQRELARRVHTVTGSTHVTWLMGVYFYSTASKCESSLARTETLREKPKKRFGALLQALVDDDVVDVLPAALPVGVVALARLQALCLAPPRPAPPGTHGTPACRRGGGAPRHLTF